MGRNLHRRSSDIAYENNHPGCMASVLHFFDLHQRFHIRKMLMDRKHGEGRRSSGVRNSRLKQNGPSTKKGPEQTDVKPLLEAGDLNQPPKVTDNNAQIIGFTEEKMAKKRTSKQKLSSFTSQLVRTISIHHMENDDYVYASRNKDVNHCKHHSDTSILTEHGSHSNEDTDMAFSGNRCEFCGSPNTTKTVDHDQSDVSDLQSVEKREHLQEKLNEAKEYVRNLRGNFASTQAKNFLDALEIFNANREIFLRIMADPDSLSPRYLEDLQKSSLRSVLTKSGSFPGAGQSGRGVSFFKSKRHRTGTGSSTRTDRKSQSELPPAVLNSKLIAEAGDGLRKSYTASSYASKRGGPAEVSLRNKQQLKNMRSNGAARHHFKDIKQRIKEIIKHGNKDRNRISMDGILHKVPYGQKLPPKESRSEGPMSNRCSPCTSFRSDYTPAYQKPGLSVFRRSQSLTESLDKYSNLFNSNQNSNSKGKSCDRMKLAHEDAALLASNSSQTLARISSLPELESNISGKYARCEVPQATILSRCKSVDSTKINSGIGNKSEVFYKQKPKENIVDAESVTETLEIEKNKIEEHDTICSPCTADGVSQQFSPSAETDDGGEKHGLLDESQISRMTEIASDDSKSITKENHVDKPVECFQDDIHHIYEGDNVISSAAVSVSEDQSKWSCVNYERMDSLVQPERDVSADVFEFETIGQNLHNIQQLQEMEVSSPTTDTDSIVKMENDAATHVDEADEAATYISDEILSPCKSTLDALHIQIDSKEEAEFNYVLDILNRSGFSRNELLGRWYSPDLPLDPSLFEELEESTSELDMSSCESEINLDHLLLFDLINEVLLEIYEAASALCPWFSCFDSHPRLVPVGSRVLEEVWVSISWHLRYQPVLNPTIDYIVGRDMAKDERWMNLRHDSEEAGAELEEMIMDDLLNSEILEFLIKP